jgi:hypothetical protein
MKYFRFCADYKYQYKNIINRLALYLQEMYEYHFRPEKTGGVSTFHITFADALPKLVGVVEPIIYTCAIVDWQQLETMSDEERLIYLLETCQKSILSCVQCENWNAQPFENAYQQIIDNKFGLRTHWKKAVPSSDRQYKAQVYFEYDYEKTGTYIDFTDKTGNLVKRVQFTPNGYAVLCKTIGNIIWTDSSHIRIYYIQVPKVGAGANCNTRYCWLISTDGEVDFCDAKAEQRDSHALYQLGCAYYEGEIVLEDRVKGLALIKQSAELKYKHAQKWLMRYEEK